MVLTIFLLILGAIFLYKGADFLVSGSSNVAKVLGISTLVIGMTVVSFGTVVPELFVGILAAFRGETLIPVGNLIGTIMFNLAFVMGLMALILPFSVEKYTVRRELLFLILALVIFFLLGSDSNLSRLDGVVLLILFIILNYYYFKKLEVKVFWHEISSHWRLFFRNLEHIFLKEKKEEEKSEIWQNIIYVFLGLFLTFVGARLLLGSAEEIAKTFGISQLVIGLTIIAIGTSLPELATALTATFRKKHDVGVGDLMGAGLNNILLVIGLVAVIQPITLNANVLRFDFPVLILVLLLLLLFMRSKNVLSRLEGFILICFYLVYIIYICFTIF